MITGQLFFELLQVAIGRRTELSGTPSQEEWLCIYNLCEQQTLVGIGYVGIQLLPSNQWPPKEIIMKWTAYAERIAARNIHTNNYCGRVCSNFEKEGFHCCILKGQSNISNYPKTELADGTMVELGRYRTPGDIDAWVTPAGKCRYPVRKVIEYIQGICPGNTIYYHHSDFPVIGDTEIEVHYRPSFLYSPLRNMRLQRWFRVKCNTCIRQGGGGFNVPSNEFNIVFQLTHIFKHMFEEGIGLRQILDYYCVVKSEGQKIRRTTEEVGNNYGIEGQLKYLGLYKFACAIMYVLHEVFSLPEDEMIVPMDRKEGRFLLDEIMIAGNFGHYDDRIAKHETSMQRALRKLRRNFRFVRLYPEEVVCEPFFRVYHYLWRTLKLWKLE